MCESGWRWSWSGARGREGGRGGRAAARARPLAPPERVMALALPARASAAWLAWRRPAAFGAAQVSVAALNSIWVSFAVLHFTGRARAAADGSAAPFVCAQLVYLLWNCVNDPLLGLYSDAGAGAGVGGCAGCEGFGELNGVIGSVGEAAAALAARRRARAVRTGGMVMAMAFALAWWIPEPRGAAQAALHYLLALGSFDAGLTLVEVNHRALMADLTSAPGERQRLNAAAAIAGALGSLTPALAHAAWESSDPRAFRALAAALAIAAAPGFAATARVAAPPSAAGKAQAAAEAAGEAARAARAAGRPPRRRRPIDAAAAGLRRLASQRNLQLFSLWKLLQCFSCCFEKNHLPLLLVALAPPWLTPARRAVAIGAAFVAPHVATLLLCRPTGVVHALGVHRSIELVMCGKLMHALVLGAGGVFFKSPAFLAAHLVLGRVLTEMSCRLAPLAECELVDEDAARHAEERGGKSAAATVVGVVNMLSKPGESIAPLLGVALLDASGWTAGGMTSGESSLPTSGDKTGGAAALARTVVAVAVCVTAAQLALWRRYTLRGLALEEVRRVLKSRGSAV